MDFIYLEISENQQKFNSEIQVWQYKSQGESHDSNNEFNWNEFMVIEMVGFGPGITSSGCLVRVFFPREGHR